MALLVRRASTRSLVVVVWLGLVWLGLVCLTLFGVVALLFHAYFTSVSRPVERFVAVDQDRMWPRVSADLRAAATFPGAALPVSRTTNAGAVLDARLTWEGHRGEVLRAGAPDEQVDPAILAVLKEAGDGDLASALADVRQLANLLRSTETLVGAMVGTVLQRYELDVRRSHVVRIGSPLGPPPFPDEEALEQQRRLVWAMGLFPALVLPPERLAERLEEIEGSPMACLALAESSEFALHFRAGLGRSHRATYALLQAGVERQAERCGLQVVRGWFDEDSPGPSDALAGASTGLPLGLGWAARLPIPFLRAEVYEWLLSAATRDGLSRYKRDHTLPEAPGPVTR